MRKRNNLLSTVFSPCLQFVCISSLLVILVSMVAGKLLEADQVDTWKIVFWNIEYFFVMALCMEVFGWTKSVSRKQLLWVSGLYTISFSMVWISSEYQVLNFWMLGALLLALLIPKEMAIAVQIILSFTYCMVNGQSVETFICYFAFGTLILLLAGFLDKLKNVLAIALIAVTTNVAFLILLNNFALKFSEKVVFQLISTAVMVLFIWGIRVCYQPSEKNTVLFREELMEKLKQYSENLYQHSLFVGKISEGAAAKIQVREDLAYAGGCYHELGRITGDDYIAGGVELLKKNGISKEVIAIVKEHNMHHGVPASKEAAIVMLCDSIASTIQYLKVKQPDTEVSMEHIVNSIFSKRFEKGLFDQTGLSLEELGILKNYFIETFQK